MSIGESSSDEDAPLSTYSRRRVADKGKKDNIIRKSKQLYYFDENKVKKEIKVSEELSIEELKSNINNINVENMCLKLERSRINAVKLSERKKLHFEIKRLKNVLKNLKVKDGDNEIISNNKSSSGVINAMKKYLDNPINLQELHLLKDSLESASLTSISFWEDFNKIEFAEKSGSKPYWCGDLKNISPDSNNYYIPNSSILKLVNSVNHEVSRSIDNKIDETKIATGDNFFDNNDSCSSHDNDDLELENCNSDWNILATKLKEKNNKLNENTDLPCDTQVDFQYNNTVLNKEAYNVDTSPLIQKNEDSLCIECGNNASWESFITRHRKAYQNNVKLPTCNACNQRFLKSGHFDGKHRLKRSTRKVNRPHIFICDICGQGCTTVSGLSQHRLKHEDPSNSCPYCPYKCRRKGYLKIHIKTHSQKDPLKRNFKCIKDKFKSKLYACDSCSHVSKTPQLFRLHKSLHTSSGFMCKHCPYKTSKSSAFKQHMRIHTGEKPFHCTYCSYKSSCKSYLKSHIRYHTGEKPFKCEQCSYQCVTSTRLNIHRKKHGEKEFPCKVCEYRCTSKYDLKAHHKVHENRSN